MEKKIMKLACSFNRWLRKKYGVISADEHMPFGKEVHMKADAFFKMFITYDRFENYTDGHDKVYVHEDGVTYFALVERKTK